MSTMTGSQAAEMIRAHHGRMVTDLNTMAADLIKNPEEGRRAALVEWATTVLVPHATTEEKSFYPAAATLPVGKPLVDGMISEHGVILGLVDALRETPSLEAAGAYADALARVFASHADKENNLVIPQLVAAPGVDLPAERRRAHGEE